MSLEDSPYIRAIWGGACCGVALGAMTAVVLAHLFDRLRGR